MNIEARGHCMLLRCRHSRCFQIENVLSSLVEETDLLSGHWVLKAVHGQTLHLAKNPRHH